MQSEHGCPAGAARLPSSLGLAGAPFTLLSSLPSSGTPLRPPLDASAPLTLPAGQAWCLECRGLSDRGWPGPPRPKDVKDWAGEGWWGFKEKTRGTGS